MEKVNSIEDVLKKVEELRTTLKFSDEIFPLISDVFMFIREIIPLMLEANSSIKESTNQLPNATENITNVSKTTEMATNEVLDKLDYIMGKMEVLRNDIKNGGESEGQLAILGDIQDKSSEIIYAFQFQDITTQQLEHVHRILEAIYEKFLTLFNSFNRLKSNSDLGGDVIRAIENELKGSTDKKNKEYFEKRTEDIIHQSEISQDDIDRFFK